MTFIDKLVALEVELAGLDGDYSDFAENETAKLTTIELDREGEIIEVKWVGNDFDQEVQRVLYRNLNENQAVEAPEDSELFAYAKWVVANEAN